MRLPPGIRWLLFDAVGTLIYPHPPVAAAYATAAHRYGSRLTTAEIDRRFRAAFAAHATAGGATSEDHERRRWQKIVAATIDDIPTHHAADLFADLWDHFAQPHHWRLYDDATPALAALAKRGYNLAIASNFDGRLKKIAAGHPPLAPCQHVFVSSDLGASKPSLGFFRAIEQRLPATPDQLVLIGDDELQDIQGATAAGWTSLHLTRDQRDPPRTSLATLAALAP